MGAISTIFFFVALLPSIIYGEQTILKCLNDVIKIAKKDGLIEGIFQPKGDAPLGEGSFAFTFRGFLLPIKKVIAMKFTLSEDISDAKKEYEMYTYLNAINNSGVERYGIPAVYYFGKWNKKDAIMMGLSLLDQDIQKLWKNSGDLFKRDVNVLIIMRDFILASKYMHSLAVRHDDIKIENMMVRKHRSFLIDFNISSKMNERSKLGTPMFVSRRAHTTGERYPKDDWESFLYSMCYNFGAYFNWIGFRSPDEMYNRKSNITAIIEKIKVIESDSLKNIFIELALHIFDDGGKAAPFYNASNSKRFPDYDRFYKLVNDVIEKSSLPLPVMFTWLTREQRDDAIDDLNEHPIPNITEISDPKDYDFSTMEYPVVDFKKFTRAYRNWNAKSVWTASASNPARNSTFGDALKKMEKSSCFDCFVCGPSNHQTNN